MTKQEYIKFLSTKTKDLLSNFDFQKEVLQDLISIGLSYVEQHHKNEDDNSKNMMLQMSLLKATTILQLGKGSVLQRQETIKNSIIDIHSISSIFRSLFENYCFFNHLYVQKRANEELMILENLWKISSLTQRYQIVDMKSYEVGSENYVKIEREKKSISEMINQIKLTSIYQANEKFITSAIKGKKWQIDIENGKLKYIGWKDMFENSLKNKQKLNRTYQMMSLDAHPTYFSVFQFGVMYKDEHHLSRRATITYQTIELLCSYLYDFQFFINSNYYIKIDSKFLIEILGKNKIS